MSELARVRGEANAELHELAYQIAGVAAVHDREELLDRETAHGLRAGRVGTLLKSGRPRRPAEVRVRVAHDAARQGEGAVVELELLRRRELGLLAHALAAELAVQGVGGRRGGRRGVRGRHEGPDVLPLRTRLGVLEDVLGAAGGGLSSACCIELARGRFI